MGCFFKLKFHVCRVLQSSVHHVHVTVPGEGESSLCQLAVLIGENFLLVVQVGADVAVKVILLLTHSVKISFVLNLTTVGVHLLFECRVLLE